jgi:hypothetical protein
MEICINVGGRVHCFVVPVYQIPIHFPRPGPDPHNYPQLFQDAILIASLQSVASQVSDGGVRGALLEGVRAATRALQARGGAHVSVKNEPAHEA